ncbi:hypothetical protein H6P81_017162 [Aristolochia fimbriata]|uniref:Methyltransferase-like protein 1 n=1 Tax=Aristolochia fimbriata TaxID=158543 RepID=A0AAV7DXK5_ARIFI|nr:hypothetical protein H6P81_017162 [Aristolochia fimbriata]
MRRDFEENSDMKNDKIDEEEDWEDAEKRKHRSSKSRKYSGVEEAEERDSSGKRKLSDREGKKRSGGSSRADSGDDDDDYDVRRESRSKATKRSQEDHNEKKSGSTGPERELDSSRKFKPDEIDRNSSRKAGAKASSHENFQGRTKSKVDTLMDGDVDKMQDRDPRYSERKESGKDKGPASREQDRNPRRRWDEPDSARKPEDSGYPDKADLKGVKGSDKQGASKERNLDGKIESSEAKNRGSDSNPEKASRSSNRDEKRVDGDAKGRSRSEAHEEDSRLTPREERTQGGKDDKQRRVRDDIDSSAYRLTSRVYEEKSEKQRSQRDSTHGNRDDRESREKSEYADDDGRGRMRDRSGRELRRGSNRSRTPERSGRRRQDSDDADRGFSDSDNERSGTHRGKEREKDGHRDDRSKGRDSSSWSERSRDWESSKDGWKKRQQSRHDKELKDGYSDFDYEKDWDSQKRERERIENEKLHGQPGYRRERSRPPDSSRTSSFGNMNDSSDLVEIRTKSLEYGRDESAFVVRRTDSGLHHDFGGGGSDDEWGYKRDDRSRMSDIYGPNDDKQDRYLDEESVMLDQGVMSSGRSSYDMPGEKGRGQKGSLSSSRPGAGQTSSSGSQPLFGNNQGLGPYNRNGQQAVKVGGRIVRGGRGRITGRDAQRVGLPLPMMGPPIGPMGLPPGHMQPIGPNMSPAPGPPINPGVFIQPFPGPLVWPGARGVDMNLLQVPPGLAPVPPPGPSGPRFPPNMGSGPNPAMYFNQPVPGRGVSPGLPSPGFNAIGPMGRGSPHDKSAGGWVPPRTSGPPGKAPSRGEQNDYSQNFVDTGMRPQNFIRELELTSTVEDYPKLRELIQKKDEIVAKSATPPMYFKCDLREFVLSPEYFGTKFDVILVDPPWEEYVHRCPGGADHMEYWTFEEILNLKIEAIADTPSFIFLWVGDGVGLEQGRACLKKWGFRRCEDICWVKTNKTKNNSTSGLRHDSHTLFQHSKEHCLMGIKGTVRRSTDGHIIHANIDTDIIIGEEPLNGATNKPEDLYRIIEHFSLGRRRIELFGEDHNIRSGWLTVGKGLSSSNFNSEAYMRNFADKDGKVWVGGGGRNPPPDAPHLVLTTPEIESLRPKSPPAKSQQQQSTSIQTTANSSNKRPAVNSPQNPNVIGPLGLNQEVSGSTPATPAPWASPIGGMKGGALDAGGADDKFFDGYGFNPSCGQPGMDHLDFDPHRNSVNLL